MAQWKALTKSVTNNHYRNSGLNVLHTGPGHGVVDISTIYINGSGVSSGDDRYFYYDLPTSDEDKKYYRNISGDYGIKNGYWDYSGAYSSNNLYNYYDYNMMADCHPYTCSRFLQGVGKSDLYVSSDVGKSPIMYTTVWSYSKMVNFNSYVSTINSWDNGKFANCAKTLSACQSDSLHFARIGAMIVWTNDGGSYSHTAIIEEIKSDCIYVSTGSAGRGTCFERERCTWSSNGWSKGADGGFTFKGIILNPYVDDTPTTTYTLTFNANGGSGSMSPLTLNEGQYDVRQWACGFTPPTGKEFLGWGLSPSTSTPATIITMDSNRTLYAIWKTIKISITYYSNNGLSQYKIISIDYGSSHTIIDCPQEFTPPPNKKFKLWNTKSDGSGDSIMPGVSQVFHANKIYYAQWENALISHIYLTNKKMINGYIGDKKIKEIYLGNKLIFK